MQSAASSTAYTVVRYCGWFLIVLTLLFLRFAVFPAYQSGLYQYSDAEITQGHFDVPGYDFDPHTGAGNWRVLVALLSGVCTLYLSFPAWLILVGVLVIERRSISYKKRALWIMISVFIATTLLATWNVGYTLLSWIAD